MSPIFCPLAADWGSVADWVSGIASTAAVIVALVLALKGSFDDRARVRRIERSSARKTLVKLGALANSLNNLRLDFKRQVDAAPPENQRDFLWPYVNPVIALRDDERISFDADETDLLLNADEDQFVVDLGTLATQYASLVKISLEYRAAHKNIEQFLGTPVEIVGKKVKYVSTKEQQILLFPMGYALDDILNGLLKRLEEGYERLNDVIKRFGPICRKYLKDPNFPDIKELP